MKQKIDEDILRNIYLAVIKQKCYSQDICTEACPIGKKCEKICNSLGLDDGDFDNWPTPYLAEVFDSLPVAVVVAYKQEQIIIQSKKLNKKLDKVELF